MQPPLRRRASEPEPMRPRVRPMRPRAATADEAPHAPQPTELERYLAHVKSVFACELG